MKRVTFSASNNRLPFASFAVVRPGESAIDAVRRSIERTTGYLAYSCRSAHYTRDNSGTVTSETLSITLTERKRVNGGHGVVAEIQVTI